MASVALIAAVGPGVGRGHLSRMEALAEALAGRADTVLTSAGGPIVPSWRHDAIIVDVPASWHAATDLSGCVWVEEGGDVCLPDGRVLRGLAYAMLRRGFLRARPAVPPTPDTRVFLHYAQSVSDISPGLQVVQLTDHPRPWEIMATCSRCVTYPSQTALEAACLGLVVSLLPSRNLGEARVRHDLEVAAREPGLFAAVDGRGADRVADAILA